MSIEFRKDIITRVPACNLIECCQILQAALRTHPAVNPQKAMQTVYDCLSDCIENYTPSDKSAGIHPSPSSLLAPGVKSGILMHNGQDILCGNHKPISDAMCGGVCQCCRACEFYGHECRPEQGILVLESGYIHDPAHNEDQQLIDRLTKYFEQQEADNT